VTAARHRALYSDVGVPDTPEGRFELVALHLFLALEPIKSDSTAIELSRRTIEAFVTDMDDCMREMGVGDMAVGKKVKRAAAAFYERAGAYRRALAGQGPDLEANLRDYVLGNVIDDGARQERAEALARYMRAAFAVLASSDTPFETIVENGTLDRLLSNH
jgi:cytochrome b pre-mRNA-processing protein 3